MAAVDGISFRLPPGSITGLLGGNGAGKTTTIAMIMGLVTPTSGTVTVLGAQMPNERYRVLHRMNFESPYVALPMRLTVRQNLSVFAQLYAVADIDARIAGLAADLDLTEFLDRPTGKLSAGQKTRVSLAKALLNRPEVLLLDEPTASLDPDTADWVRGRLDRYRREQGATVLLASHNMTEVERLCERVIIMKTGPHRGRRHAGRACSTATDARRWRRCSSTSRADAANIARPRNDRQRQRPRFFRQSRRRHGAALLVSAALVLAARARPDLLADGADADVGLPAALRDAERRVVRARDRRVHRRGAAVGYSVPRPARIFDFVPGGDVRRTISATS